MKLRLPRRDDDLGRVADLLGGEDVGEQPLAVVLHRGRTRQRDVAVERRVLAASRRLHRGDDLARHAQLGEGVEARLACGIVVTNRLEQADHAFLDDVVAIGADEEVRTGLRANQPPVAANEFAARVLVPVACGDNQPDVPSALRPRPVRGRTVVVVHCVEPPLRRPCFAQPHQRVRRRHGMRTLERVSGTRRAQSPSTLTASEIPPIATAAQHLR